MSTTQTASLPPDLSRLRWTLTSNDHKYLVSTERDLIDVDFVNAAFESKDMPWAKRLTQLEAVKMLDNSLTLGLYESTSGIPRASSISEPSSPRTPSPSIQSDSTSPRQIGMARLITDHVTFAYLTDVIVLPEHRRGGLARWLMACCREVLESMPAMRRGFLVTSLAYGEAFYKETLGFTNVTEDNSLIALTKADYASKSRA